MIRCGAITGLPVGRAEIGAASGERQPHGRSPLPAHAAGIRPPAKAQAENAKEPPKAHTFPTIVQRSITP